MEGLNELSLAGGYTRVIKCKMKKLLKEYRVTHQMEGLNEYINLIFSYFLR
jgi:hypothetical protein